MKTITITTLKGGVGKTNACFNLIGMLAKKKNKILAIDCDPQANLTSDFDFGEDIDDYEYLGTIYDEMIKGKDINPLNIVVKSPLSDMPTVDLIPSHIYLSSIEMRIVSNSIRYKLFKKYMDLHQSFFEKYDYIIFDTAPNLSVINQNALYVADNIILISDIGINSLKGAKKAYEEWLQLAEAFEIPNNMKWLLINKFDKRIKMSNEVIEYVNTQDILKELSLETILPDNIKLRETEMLNQPIAYYDTKNVGYETYKELVKELTKKGVL